MDMDMDMGMGMDMGCGLDAQGCTQYRTTCGVAASAT